MTKRPPHSDNDHWIDPLDAVHILSSRVGGDAVAKKAILERLKDCAIETTAKWFAMAVDVGRPYVDPVVSFEYEVSETQPRLSSSQYKELFFERAMPTVSTSRFGDGLAFMADRGDSVGGALWAAVNKSDFKRWDWKHGLFLASRPAGTWMDKKIPRTVS